MRLVLAASDRDFLCAYGKWLENQDMNTEAVFDAMQLQKLISTGEKGICILDERLPLMAHSAAIEMLKSAGWSVLVLSGEQQGDQRTLKYPFSPEDLMAAVRRMLPPVEERQGTVS